MAGLLNPLADYRTVLRGLVRQDQWRQIAINAGWTAVVTGSGSTAQGSGYQIAQTGVTATSTALLRSANAGQYGLSRGQTPDKIDWTKPFLWQIVLTPVGTTNGVSRLTLGKTAAMGLGDLSAKGLGIKHTGATRALYGVVHNGTTLTTVDLSTALSSFTTERITILSDGLGNVEWLVHDVSKGTTALGPAALGTAAQTEFYNESDNGGDAATQYSIVHDMKLWIAQS